MKEPKVTRLLRSDSDYKEAYELLMIEFDDLEYQKKRSDGIKNQLMKNLSGLTSDIQKLIGSLNHTANLETENETEMMRGMRLEAAKISKILKELNDRAEALYLDNI